jgi:hypothetical protein
LHETNLGEGLREKEKIINENKFEIKDLDQELIMIKIETALLKCQMEETVIEQLEFQRFEALLDDSEDILPPDLTPVKQESAKVKS